MGEGNTFTNSKVGLFSATNVNDYTTFNIISCDEDGGSALGSGLMSVVYATGLIPNNTYYIAVDKFSSATPAGTFCIAVDELDQSMLATSNTCADSYQAPTGSNAAYTGWQPLLNSTSKLIALVRNPAGGEVEAYTVSQNINSGPVRTDPASGQKYLDRNFRINNSGIVSNVDVQFFFFNSELTALHNSDSVVALDNLGVTRQTGSTCQADFLSSNGTNSYLTQTGNGTSSDGLVKWVQLNTPGFCNFYLHTSKAYFPVQVYLQGAMQTGVAGGPYRHKDVTSIWAGILNANALIQPYGTAPYNVAFNYAGNEHVNSGFFTSSTDTTDVLDWVLVELRDATTPSTVIMRRAAFIREDGRIVDLNGRDSLSFRGVSSVIRHRNLLPVRTATTQALNGALGSVAPALYNFSNGQSKAYQNPTVLTNAAMKDFGNGLFGMWGGNVDLNTNVKFTGPFNDAAALLGLLGSNQSAILNSQYSRGDVDMNGTVKFTGPFNDAAALLGFLGSNQSAIFTQHQ